MANTLHNGIRGRSPAWPGGRALALAAVAVLGVASLAGWALYRNGGLPTLHAPVNLATVVQAELPSQGTADTVDRPQSGDIVATPRRTVVRHPMRVQFDETDDLYAYVQSLETRVRERDADAIWMVSRVYDYCSGFAMAPAAYDRDTRVLQDMAMRGSAAMVSSRERVARRCARFVPQDELTPRMVLLKRIEAADAGSLAAEAALMATGQPVKNTPEYKRDLVERVQRSADPEAYSALSPGMGIAASGQADLADKVAGTQFSELAWQLAACRLGLDCGPQSALMTQYCANGGICSRDSSQDFERFVFDAAIPRQSADVINEMVDSLMGEQRARQ